MPLRSSQWCSDGELENLDMVVMAQHTSGLPVHTACMSSPSKTLCSEPSFFSKMECSTVPSFGPSSEKILVMQSAGSGACEWPSVSLSWHWGWASGDSVSQPWVSSGLSMCQNIIPRTDEGLAMKNDHVMTHSRKEELMCSFSHNSHVESLPASGFDGMTDHWLSPSTREITSWFSFALAKQLYNF